MINYNNLQDTKDISSASKENSSRLIGILIFVCGFFSWHKLIFVGEVFTVELAIVPLALVIYVFRKAPLQVDGKLFIKYVGYLILMLVGYMLSDLIGQTPTNLYMRGWGRVILLVTDFIAITVFLGVQRNTLIWFLMGSAIGHIAILLVTGTLNFSTFKFSWSTSVILIVCCMLPLISIRLTSLILIPLGMIYILYDYRSLGAIVVVLGGILFIGSKNSLKNTKLLPIAIIGLLAVFAIKTTLEMTNGNMNARRQESSIVRYAALSIGIQAIMDSPVFGSGSWGNGTEKYAKEFYEITHGQIQELEHHSNAVQSKAFVAHSQLLQAWMEGGIFAAAFFIFYGYQLIKSLKFVFFQISINSYSAIYGFNLIMGFWDLFMTPFAGGARLLISCTMAVTLCLNYQNKTMQIAYK
jgi:O-antigen ligase